MIELNAPLRLIQCELYVAFRRILSLGLLVSLSVTTYAAEESTVTEGAQLQSTQKTLIQAKATLTKAEEAAVEIIRAAELEAQAILHRANLESKNQKASPLAIKNEEVAVELHGATVEEIANALMPHGWRVLVDVKETEIKERRFQYISTKSRDQALIGLTKPLDLNYRYFFNLKNEAGESSPLLVISDS